MQPLSVVTFLEADYLAVFSREPDVYVEGGDDSEGNGEPFMRGGLFIYHFGGEDIVQFTAGSSDVLSYFEGDRRVQPTQSQVCVSRLLCRISLKFWAEMLSSEEMLLFVDDALY